MATITINNENWSDIYTILGIDVGSPMTIQNTGNYPVEVYEGDTAPSTTDNVGALLYKSGGYPSKAEVQSGSGLIWARVYIKSLDVIKGSRLFIQEL